LSNIKFSGLKGQALEIKDKDIPSIKDFKMLSQITSLSAIPKLL